MMGGNDGHLPMSTLPPRGPVTIWTLETLGAFLRLSEWMKYFHAYQCVFNILRVLVFYAGAA